MSTFKLSDLIPQRDVLDFGNDVKLEFLSRVELSAVQLAYFSRLQNEAQAHQAMLGTISDSDEDFDGERVAEMTENFNEILEKLLKVIVVGITDEHLEKLTLGYRAEIVRWWAQQQSETKKKPVKKPNSQPDRRKRK